VVQRTATTSSSWTIPIGDARPWRPCRPGPRVRFRLPSRTLTARFGHLAPPRERDSEAGGRSRPPECISCRRRLGSPDSAKRSNGASRNRPEAL